MNGLISVKPIINSKSLQTDFTEFRLPFLPVPDYQPRMQKIFNFFRNGVEVPVYTSVSSGPLSSNDYIEFWGQMNDGKADKPLYRNPAYQHTTKWSLQSDTAVYFLTLNPSGGSTFHYNTITNDTTSNILPVSPTFMYTTGTYFHIPDKSRTGSSS